ncbi:MAG: TonB family protein [Pseudomonadota bacterium]
MQRGLKLLLLVWSCGGGAAALAQDLDQRPVPEKQEEAPRAPALTKAPQLLTAAEPVYPPEALAARLSADVTMDVDLDASGRVTGAAITAGAGHGFDEAALAAVKASTFSPAEIDGRPSAVRFSYTLHFVPRVVPPPVPPTPPPPDPIVATGRLREKGTRDPLPGAEVSTGAARVGDVDSPATVVAVTDEDGRFVVRAKPGVGLRILVTGADHDPCLYELDGAAVSAETPATLDCVVARASAALHETKVRGQREARAVTRYTLSQPELTTVPGTFGDPLRVVQNLPGVARTPFGLGLLVIRGASPQDSGVFVEGHQVPILYHFLGGPSVLTPRLIDRIDFYPGNFGVKYGRATAGIVDVDLKTDPTPRLHGLVDLNLLDSSAYVEGPLGRGWTGSVSARRSYIDLLLPAFLSGGTTAAPVYWDYQAGAHRRLGSGQLSLFAIGSNDSLKVVSRDASRGDIDLGTSTGFHRLIGLYATNVNGWTNSLSPALGYDRLRFSAGAVDVNRAAWVFELRDELTRAFSKTFAWRAGLDALANRDDLFFDLPAQPDARLYGPTDPTAIQHTTVPLNRAGLAVYTDATWDAGAGFRLIPGVRADLFRYVGQDRATVDPRMVVRWTSSAAQIWKAGAGIFHQMPEPQLLDPAYGNPHLPPIWADQYSFGFERRLRPALTADATGYLVRRHNQPVPPPPFSPAGQERSYGLELIVKHEFTARFYGWLAYTLSWSEQTAYAVNAAQQGMPNMGNVQTVGGAATTSWFPTDYDQRHNLIAVGSYQLSRWRLGGRFRLVSGGPQTPVAGSVYDADLNQYQCQYGATNSARKPTFHQLDVRVDRTWTFRLWELSAYLDVQNVYNAQNPEATIYDYRCRGSEAIRGLPILPILGVRGLF